MKKQKYEKKIKNITTKQINKTKARKKVFLQGLMKVTVQNKLKSSCLVDF